MRILHMRTIAVQLLQIVVLTTRCQLGGQKLAQEAKLEAQRWPRRPTWRPTSDLGGELGGPKLTLEANLEAQAAKETNLEAEMTSRRPT